MVVGGVCTALTGGAGTIGCAALGGAVGNAVAYGLKTPRDQQSAGGYLKEAAIGAAAGGATAGLGSLGAKALRTLGSRAAGALSGAGGKGAGGRLAKAVCNCFPAGAKVATATGATPIQRIRVGDRVWARDLASGRSELRRVSGLFHKQATRLLAITVAGTSIQVTPEHPFWSHGKGWVLAGHLRTGDRLLARDGRTVTIAKTASRAVKVTVYNFEVEGDHNYYISTAQLLVHNCPVSGGTGGGAGEGAAAGSSGPTREAVYRKARDILAGDLVRQQPREGSHLVYVLMKGGSPVRVGKTTTVGFPKRMADELVNDCPGQVDDFGVLMTALCVNLQ